MKKYSVLNINLFLSAVLILMLMWKQVNNLIEREFFDLDEFSSKADFWFKINTYQFYFNYFRKNSYKYWKSQIEE
ncbi:MAG TPA: hypothetical protein PK189_11680 [bacterium]|nr:hypothetical protein [bacterium]